jgi:tungstate transport system ATP-binding protein
LRLVGLQAVARRDARVLSAGEQQRLALARAAALRPDLIWLDEPTANLDPSATRLIEATVLRMTDEGVTCVMSTHDIGQARRLAQRVLLMARGRIVEATSADRFFSEPETPAGRRYLRGDLLDE